MLDRIDKLLPSQSLSRIEVLARLWENLAIRKHIKRTFQLLGKFLFQNSPNLLSGSLQFVAGFLVHIM